MDVSSIANIDLSPYKAVLDDTQATTRTGVIRLFSHCLIQQWGWSMKQMIIPTQHRKQNFHMPWV